MNPEPTPADPALQSRVARKERAMKVPVEKPRVESLLIGTKALAAMLGIGESTLFRVSAKGELGPAPLKVGGRRLYDVQEVRDWIASRLPNGSLPSRKQWEQMRTAKKNAPASRTSSNHSV